MATFHVGIDVAKAKLDTLLLSPQGKAKHKVVENNQAGFTLLLNWIQKQSKEESPTLHVCMEATGVYWEAVAEYFADLANVTVSVVNPAQIKAFGASLLMRTKTDKDDALLIARFCAERVPPAWQAPSKKERALRAMVLRLDALKNIRTQESNRLLVAREAVVEGITRHLSWLDEEIKALEKAIDQHIKKDPDLRQKHALLDSVPGLGDCSIAVFLSFYGDPTRFANARQATAFAGLDPRQHESGSSVKGKPRLSKVGDPFLRKTLYMPAMTTLYKTAWGKRFQERLARAGKAPKLIIGAMMRKLIHVAFGVLKSGKIFDPTLHGA